MSHHYFIRDKQHFFIENFVHTWIQIKSHSIYKIPYIFKITTGTWTQTQINIQTYRQSIEIEIIGNDYKFVAFENDVRVKKRKKKWRWLHNSTADIFSYWESFLLGRILWRTVFTSWLIWDTVLKYLVKFGKLKLKNRIPNEPSDPQMHHAFNERQFFCRFLFLLCFLLLFICIFIKLNWIISFYWLLTKFLPFYTFAYAETKSKCVCSVAGRINDQIDFWKNANFYTHSTQTHFS